MKFTTVFFSAVLALGVCAQNVTTSPAPASTVPLTPAQSSEVACLTACSPTDTNCRNKCVSDGGATNPIASCQVQCPQGNGTSSDDANYKACIQNCIDTQGGSVVASVTPTAAAPSGTTTEAGTASGSASEPASGSAGSTTPTASGSSTATGTSSSATASKSSGADIVQVGSSFVGLLGVLAAMVAL